jgi:hypothetical protein
MMRLVLAFHYEPVAELPGGFLLSESMHSR